MPISNTRSILLVFHFDSFRWATWCRGLFVRVYMQFRNPSECPRCIFEFLSLNFYHVDVGPTAFSDRADSRIDKLHKSRTHTTTTPTENSGKFMWWKLERFLLLFQILVLFLQNIKLFHSYTILHAWRVNVFFMVFFLFLFLIISLEASFISTAMANAKSNITEKPNSLPTNRIYVKSQTETTKAFACSSVAASSSQVYDYGIGRIN